MTADTRVPESEMCGCNRQGNRRTCHVIHDCVPASSFNIILKRLTVLVRAFIMRADGVGSGQL